MFKTIEQNVSAEIVEKKSKFIANVFYIESVEEAEEKIREINKKHFAARHNCYAYRIYTKDGIVSKFSDDGEPSGTAGAPMLNIITSKELTNILIVVTRYFGGILLGTGGLVRAYTGASLKALEKVEEIQKDLGLEVKFETTYSDLEKFKYYLKQNRIRIVNVDYGENIIILVEITEEKLEEIRDREKELNFLILKIEVLCTKYIKIQM